VQAALAVVLQQVEQLRGVRLFPVRLEAMSQVQGPPPATGETAMKIQAKTQNMVDSMVLGVGAVP
jgi:hypothetical protein